MKLLIHDLTEEEIGAVFKDQLEEVVVLTDDGTIQHCIGCFSCWIKTPAKCILKDDFFKMGETLAKTDEVFIITRCTYGGFSPFVKNIFDRSIPYIHPYFEIQNNELHHSMRYPEHKLRINVWFYGDDVTDQEKEMAQSLLIANTINLQADLEDLSFVNTIDELGALVL